MKILWSMAFLNVLRNKRRSLFTVISIAVGTACMLFLESFNDSTIADMRRNVIEVVTSHVQIHAKGFKDKVGAEGILTMRPELTQWISAHPDIQASTSRIKTLALAGHGASSQGILLVGIDPQSEMRLTRIQKNLKSGSYLTGTAKRKVMIGDRFAKKMKIKTGDSIVLMANDIYGMSMGYNFDVQGIFHVGSDDVDSQVIFADIQNVRELLGITEGATEMAFLLKNESKMSEFVKELRYMTDQDVSTWNEIDPTVDQWSKWSEQIFFISLLILTVVVAMSVVNMILMSIFERTKEYGVMLAIGAHPSNVFYLILIETLFLQATGIFLGFWLGSAVVSHFGVHGISMEGLQDALETSFMSPVVHTFLRPVRLMMVGLIMCFITTVAVLPLAYRAGRLHPIKAIYFS